MVGVYCSYNSRMISQHFRLVGTHTELFFSFLNFHDLLPPLWIFLAAIMDFEEKKLESETLIL